MSDAEEVDEICDRFERAFRRGEQPSVDDFVQLIHQDLRDRLRQELQSLLLDVEQEPTGPMVVDDEAFLTEYPPLECPLCHQKSLCVSVHASDLRCENPDCHTRFELQPKGEPKLAKISHFEIVGLIGQGGFGRVWLARSEIDGAYVALKIPRVDTDSNLTQLFIKETRFAYKVLRDARTKRRIPQLVASGRDNGVDYLAFEFVPGRPLTGEIHQGNLTIRRSVDIVRQVAATLQIAHENGLVHRDIKPGNILIDEERAYVCDFGIAKVIAGTLSGSAIAEQGFTGTWMYASPEHAQADRIDARSDVFSLGIVLFELLSGSRPFVEDNPRREFQNIQDRQRTAPPLSSIKPGISPRLESICAKCLAKAPEERFQSAGELAAELDQYVDAESSDRTFVESASTQVPPPGKANKPTAELESRNRRWWGKRALQVIAAGAVPLLLFLFWNEPRPELNDDVLSWLDQLGAKVSVQSHKHSDANILGSGATEGLQWLNPQDEGVDRNAVTAICFLEQVGDSSTNFIAQLQTLPRLQTLMFQRSDLLDSSIATDLGKLENLSTLHVKANSPEECLEQLGPMKNLIELTLDCQMDLGDGSFLEKMPKLRYLWAYQPTISKQAAENLSAHKKLTTVRLLNATFVSKEEIQLLAQSTSFKKLHVGGSLVDDDVLKYLATRRQPQIFEVGIEPNDDLGVAELLSALESCSTEIRLPFTLSVPDTYAEKLQPAHRQGLLKLGISVHP